MARFGKLARQQQADFRSTLSPNARSPTDDKGRRHGYLIAHGHEAENLYPSLRDPGGGAMEFFRQRGIPWWKSARSGNRTHDPLFIGPTRNLASSQPACVNFLLPLATVPGALLTLLRSIDADVESVETIVDAQGCSSSVEIEWVGWQTTLEGGRLNRGANATSIDALILGRTRAGLRAYLLEWKYCEEYLIPEDKGAGPSGQTRRARYRHLYEAASSSFNHAIPFDEMLFDPFYQLMRMCLLGDRMIAQGVTRELAVQEASVIVVCPSGNEDYRRVVASTPIGRRHPAGTPLLDAFRTALREPQRFSVVSQEDLLEALRKSAHAEVVRPWLEYHERRYGWLGESQ